MSDAHTARKHHDRLERAINVIVDEGSTQQANDFTRLLYLRPSSFSYCPLNTFLSLKSSLNKTRTQNFAGAFFTRVGTATHEVWQETTLSVFGKNSQHKVTVLRDWLCSDHKCKHRVELQRAPPTECPQCGCTSFMTAEHQVRRRGIRGHVDEIFLFEDTKVAIIFDWKSCSASKLSRKKLGVDVAYEAQISTYAALLKKRLADMGYTVAGWCLGYFTRDNPLKRKLVFGTRMMSVATLREWRDKHEHVLHLTEQRDVVALVDQRPCKTREYAEANHSYCPFKHSCTHSDSEAREYAIDVHRTLKAAGKLPAIEFIQLHTVDKESS